MDKTKYIDMDGVLANFDREPRALQRYKGEKGFFANLEPFRENLQAVKRMIKRGDKVRIITKTPNEQADKDKLIWLGEYLPEIERHNIVLVRPHEKKADKVNDIHNAVLYDDYGKNCREWREAGGEAVKVRTGNQLLKEVYA